jgi:hypothetical protein
MLHFSNNTLEAYSETELCPSNERLILVRSVTIDQVPADRKYTAMILEVSVGLVPCQG